MNQVVLGPAVVLRPASAADGPALHALADAHYADLLPGLAPGIAAAQGRAREQRHRALFPDARELVVTAADVVAGRLLVAGSAPVVHLVDVVVDPARRGGGTGTAALRAWLAEADRAGVAVLLGVAALSTSRRWFERHGFVDDPDAGHDPLRLTMRRDPA